MFYSEFGCTTNYAESSIRKKVVNSDFAKALEEKYGENLVPVSIDLTSLDGLKDYGILNEDILGIPDINLYRECRENIFVGDSWWWLAISNSTPAGYDSSCVQYVYSGGSVNFRIGNIKVGFPFLLNNIVEHHEVYLIPVQYAR